MRKQKLIGLVVAIACALVLTAGTAGAQGKPQVIVFTVENFAFVGECPTFSFDLVSPSGGPVGSGVSCVLSFGECPFGAVGCRDVVDTLFTLDLGRGTLTLPVELEESWLTTTTVLQIDRGTITTGTGDFAGAGGSLFCAGTVSFSDTAIIPNLVCVLRIT
jgi:hypothetical protein